jgi:ADP-ribose pyrophosphatase YjhB (NUDIX family)
MGTLINRFQIMKFCSECAHPVSLKIPPDDNRPRFVCDQCHTIHYQNPKLVVGSLPVWDRDGEVKVLLCRRAIEPRRGFWTLPAGFMENDETTGQAAVRETQEEAGANIALHELYSMINVTHVSQVHLFYRATLLDLNYSAGTESLEVALFSERDLPWDDIAFQTTLVTLRHFFEQVRKGNRQESDGLYSHDLFASRHTKSAS